MLISRILVERIRCPNLDKCKHKNNRRIFIGLGVVAQCLSKPKQTKALNHSKPVCLDMELLCAEGLVHSI